MIQEKRRFTRIRFRVKAEIRVEDILYPVETIENLSVGGCLLPIETVFEPGTPCRITIVLAETDSDLSVKVEGVIIRSSPEGAAVRFTHIDPDSLFHLKSIVRYNALDPDAVEMEITTHPTLS